MTIRCADCTKNKEPTLLTLPITDFPSFVGSKNMDDDSDQLLLLQLPINSSLLTIQDLKDAHFIGNNDDEDEARPSNKKRCNLVVETTGRSFGLVRVESSNSYVLVPPSTEQPPLQDNEEPAAKRSKNDDCCHQKNATPEKIIEMPARLLRETNTFFLECKALSGIPISELRVLLSQFSYTGPPATNFGWTLESLAYKLCRSVREVKTALEAMEAFCLDDNRYGILSEEMKDAAMRTIVHTLTEWEEGVAAITASVKKRDIVKEVLKRDETLEKCVVQHCLSCWRHTKKMKDATMQEDTYAECQEDEYITIDVKKVAIFLAHSLFNSQVAPWETKTFLSKWHQLMPGVGKTYEPNLDLLAGIALSTDIVDPATAAPHPLTTNPVTVEQSSTRGSNVTYLKYFPETLLPTDYPGRFRSLFKERSRWRLNEIEPYVVPLTNEGDITASDLLLKNCRVVKDEEGKDDWYMRR